MNAWTKTASGVLALTAVLPLAAFALDGAAADGSPSVSAEADAAYAYQYANLDELIPSVQYKSDWSAADNARLGEWYAARGIEFTWEEGDGGRWVIADHQNDAAREARLAYYESQIGEMFPPEDVAAVNAEVDAIIAALADAGISAEAPLDEEGFKDLAIGISPDDPNASVQWERVNEVIAGLGA